MAKGSGCMRWPRRLCGDRTVAGPLPPVQTTRLAQNTGQAPRGLAGADEIEPGSCLALKLAQDPDLGCATADEVPVSWLPWVASDVKQGTRPPTWLRLPGITP